VRVLTKYKTIKSNGFYEETEKRSKFISYSFPVNSDYLVQQHLKVIKSKHRDARHCVYAYSLKENFAEKYSDDGEPSGTAGLPVMNAIKNFALTDVLIVVVRYFGGILLGTSGLRKMYGSGAKSAVLNAGIIEKYLCVEVRVELNYKEYGKISGIIAEYNARVTNIDYSGIIKLNFYIKKSCMDVAFKKMSDVLNGNGKFEILGESYQTV
jgi:uncharacterized YigZ family protein